MLIPPKGYLEGIRKLCDEHGILMVCDEVMNGFGRTGKLFGFMHTTPVITPDIVTMAKGINGAFVPLGALACRDHVAQHFMKNAIGYVESGSFSNQLIILQYWINLQFTPNWIGFRICSTEVYVKGISSCEC